MVVAGPTLSNSKSFSSPGSLHNTVGSELRDAVDAAGGSSNVLPADFTYIYAFIHRVLTSAVEKERGVSYTI